MSVKAAYRLQNAVERVERHCCTNFPGHRSMSLEHIRRFMALKEDIEPVPAKDFALAVYS